MKFHRNQKSVVYDNMYSKPPPSQNSRSVTVKFYVEDDPIRLMSGKFCGEAVGYCDNESHCWIRHGADWSPDDDESQEEFWMSDKNVSWWQHLDTRELSRELEYGCRNKKANAGFK